MTLPEPFDGKSRAYRHWKAEKASLLQSGIPQPVSLKTESNSKESLQLLCKLVQQHGFASYRWREQPEDIASALDELHKNLSLTQHDEGVVADTGNLSLLKDMKGTPQGKFIPYTSRAMGWHTDGYYNDVTKTLRSFTLHCINPAAKGGSLSLADYEWLYLALCDEDQDLITLLTHPQAMTLPANKDDMGHDRPDRHAPVFYCNTDGSLGARFTTRTKNIQWRTEETRAAAEHATQVLAEQTHWHHNIRLVSGQGIITRNILHRREAFEDDHVAPARQMLRGRYLQLPAVH